MYTADLLRLKQINLGLGEAIQKSILFSKHEKSLGKFSIVEIIANQDRERNVCAVFSLMDFL